MWLQNAEKYIMDHQPKGDTFTNDHGERGLVTGSY